MRCPTCGNEVHTSERICSNCGENNEYYVEPVVIKTEPQGNATFQVKNTYNITQPASNTNQGSAGLIFGILGIFLFGFIFGILALAFAKNDKNPTAARVLGIIDIVGWAFLMIVLYA